MNKSINNSNTQLNSFEQVPLEVFNSSITYSPLGQRIDVDLDRYLVEPSTWRNEINAIRSAGASDEVHLHINNGGGDPAVACAIIKAMLECPAEITGHLTHSCASAATLPFLACDKWVVADNAEFMAHTATVGYECKANNFHEYSLFLTKSVRKLLTKYYTGFFSEDEIESLLKGSDIYLDAEEVSTRLGNLAKYREDQVVSEETENTNYARGIMEKMSKEEILEVVFEGKELPMDVEEDTQSTVLWEGTELLIEKSSSNVFMRYGDRGYSLTGVFDREGMEDFLDVAVDTLEEALSLCCKLNINIPDRPSRRGLLKKVATCLQRIQETLSNEV